MMSTYAAKLRITSVRLITIWYYLMHLKNLYIFQPFPIKEMILFIYVG
jgi:hypothetical protein